MVSGAAATVILVRQRSQKYKFPPNKSNELAKPAGKAMIGQISVQQRSQRLISTREASR